MKIAISTLVAGAALALPMLAQPAWSLTAAQQASAVHTMSVRINNRTATLVDKATAQGRRLGVVNDRTAALVNEATAQAQRLDIVDRVTDSEKMGAIVDAVGPVVQLVVEQRRDYNSFDAGTFRRDLSDDSVGNWLDKVDSCAADQLGGRLSDFLASQGF